MRTIQVTGGFGATLVGDLSDSLGLLDESDVRFALVVVGEEEAPPTGSGIWEPVELEGDGTSRQVVAYVDTTVAEGHYNLAFEVTQNGKKEIVWASDIGRPDQRALVKVT